MQDMFEQPIKMMEQTWEQWRKMFGENPQWPKEGQEYFHKQLSQWISTMSTAYNSSMNAWNSMMSQNEDVLFKLFKESFKFLIILFSMSLIKIMFVVLASKEGVTNFVIRSLLACQIIL